MAVISGTSDPYKRELDKTVALTKSAQSQISKAAAGEVLGGANRGAMREMMVLIREIGRGNWSRVPGSASLLVQQLGIMKYLLNPITGAIIGLGAGLYAGYKITQDWIKALSNLKLPDFTPSYIAKHLQKANAIFEAHKGINLEIEKAKDLYDSANASAERLSETIREQFEHMRKMNEYSKSSQAEKIVEEMRINALEREAMLNSKVKQASDLASESDRKKAEADKLIASVASKTSDEENMKKRKADAEAARKDNESLKEKHWHIVPLGVDPDKWAKDLHDAQESRRKENDATIKASQDFEDTAHQNEETRKKAAELYKEAGKSDAEAAKLTKGFQDQKQKDDQKAKDEAEESAARIASEKHVKMVHGHLTALQQVGAYISPGSVALIDVNKRMEHHLSKIEKHTSKLGKVGASNRMGEVRH